jgi:glutamate-1-semialdehyde 2,1-aminomutase
VIAPSRAAATFARAEAVLAGGVDSPVRSGHAVGGTPFVQARGSGSYAYDEDGRRYIDYLMAYGPLLLGHGHPAIAAGLEAVLRDGACFGSTHPAEIELAERIRGHLPSMERLRFTSTGSEAVMGAIRTARAFTRKRGIVKFGGNYHGHFDLALLDAGASAHTADAAASGIPPSVTADLAVARYNDLADVDRALALLDDDVAAIVVEPIVGNMGLVLPEAGFLEGLFERARARGALVVFDEVIVWLRLGLGGAQGRLGLVPDLTTVGKILGGGLPIAAFGGRAEVMAVLAPQGSTFTGGTHAGNPLSVAAAHRTLDVLEAHPEWYVAMERRAQRLAAGIRRILAAHDLPYAVVQLESIVDFKFRPGGATRDYDDARAANARHFAAFYHEMRERGVLLAPSQNEVMFLSTEHDDADVDETIAAIDGAFVALQSRGVLDDGIV